MKQEQQYIINAFRKSLGYYKEICNVDDAEGMAFEDIKNINKRMSLKKIKEMM